MERRRLLFRWRGRVEGLGIFREILGPVWGVEALWQDNQTCASLCGLQYLATGMREVDGLVRAYIRVSRASEDRERLPYLMRAAPRQASVASSRKSPCWQ